MFRRDRRNGNRSLFPCLGNALWPGVWYVLSAMESKTCTPGWMTGQNVEAG